MASSLWSLEGRGGRLVVDAAAGARITSLSLQDGGSGARLEALSDSAVDADNYGSTFWTSPQSDWDWPPPPEIDRDPYAVVDASALAITLRGSPSPRLGVSVTKHHSVDDEREGFALRYSVFNASDSPKRYAPWEVTRVPARGVTFFPARGRPFGGLNLDQQGTTATTTATTTWFAHDPAAFPGEGRKAFADTRGGWLAHAAGRLLFVKQFDEVSVEARAPGQGEIEIYANDRYVELEVQGAYTTIAPGASVSWTVAWFLRVLPKDLDLSSAGAPRATQLQREALAAFAARVAGRRSV